MEVCVIFEYVFGLVRLLYCTAVERVAVIESAVNLRTESRYFGRSSTKSLHVLGARSDGLMTTQFPAAIAPVAGANVSWQEDRLSFDQAHMLVAQYYMFKSNLDKRKNKVET